MNLAVHGLSGDIRQSNTYYEDLHKCVGKFDFVMANPPFNVDKVDKERVKNDPRYPFELRKADNANYLWIPEFLEGRHRSPKKSTTTVGRAVDALVQDDVIEKGRQRILELVEKALESFEYALENEEDGRLAAKFLKSLGILESGKMCVGIEAIRLSEESEDK